MERSQLLFPVCKRIDFGSPNIHRYHYIPRTGEMRSWVSYRRQEADRISESCCYVGLPYLSKSTISRG